MTGLENILAKTDEDARYTSRPPSWTSTAQAEQIATQAQQQAKQQAAEPLSPKAKKTLPDTLERARSAAQLWERKAERPPSSG